MARRLRVVLHRSVTCLECLSSSLTKQRNTDQRRDELLLSLLRTSWPPIEPVGALYDALRDNDIVAETRTDTVARAIRDYVSHSNGAFQVRRSLRTHLASADVARSPRSPPPSAASCCANLTSTRSTSSRFSTSRPRLTQSCTSPTRTPRWPPDCPLSVSLNQVLFLQCHCCGSPPPRPQHPRDARAHVVDRAPVRYLRQARRGPERGSDTPRAVSPCQDGQRRARRRLRVKDRHAGERQTIEQGADGGRARRGPVQRVRAFRLLCQIIQL